MYYERGTFTGDITKDTAMPFENLEKMERYVMEKLSGAFPKLSFQEKEGHEVLVDMGVDAFMKKGIGIAVQYETDSQQHIFIKKMEMTRAGAGEEKSFSDTEKTIRMVLFNYKNRQFFGDCLTG